jgi:hypothetical protein
MQTAVEYYYPAWNSYFVTSSPDEIAGLDGGAYGGAWQRTGETFTVWTQPVDDAVPACRFFSTRFAPKSSHFFTPYASECASLKAGTGWQYEGTAFYVLLPDANGNCPAGTTILYRLYNNSIGGAPNHRFTTSPATFNQMRASGWVVEGQGRTGASACVPAPPAPGTPGTNPSVAGSVDAVDQQSVLGWACYTGDANSKLSVELWAIDGSTGGWVYVATAVADKQQTAVGSSGQCGSGLESNYHGFELAVYPDHILNRNKHYLVYAYHRPTDQLLAGGGRAVGFPESGLPTSGYWRTDFDDPNLRSPALLSCIWPFPGANQRGDANDDPLWLDGAGATWSYGPSAPLQFVSPSNWCIHYDTARANPPLSWAQSNSATSAPDWPTANFWVVSANNEPAYSQLNSGPPNQSMPLNAGGVYSVAAVGDGFVLGLDNTRTPKDSSGNVIVTGGTPYLSIGAQMGRGSAGALAFVDPGGPDTYLEFSATKNVEIGAANPYHAMYAFIEAMWGGIKRMIVVSLQPQATGRAHWNWNVYPSLFYPGAELNFISIDDLVSHCGLQNASAQKMDGVPVGVTLNFSIPIRGLFQCIDDQLVPALAWTAARPASRPLLVSGIHLAIEQGPGRPDNRMQVTYSTPRLVKK